MTTRDGLEQVITDHLSAWAAPCKVVRDNEPAQTKDDVEFIRMTVQDGISFLQEAAGLLDVTGSTAAHPFILYFEIFTEINTGTLRSAQIQQSISDHWAYRQIGNVLFDSATNLRLGEDGARYRTAVSVDAARYETLSER